MASTFYLHEFWWGVLFQPIVITALDAFVNEWITPALLPHCFASSRLVITCSRSKSWEQGALKLQPLDWPPSDSNAKSPNAAAPINLMAHDTSTNEYTCTTLDSCCPADTVDNVTSWKLYWRLRLTYSSICLHGCCATHHTEPPGSCFHGGR